MNLLKIGMILFRKIRKYCYTFKAKLQLKSYGKGLSVNSASKFSANVKLGDNCKFNGIRVRGIGSLEIGDNFHSGNDLIIITSSHDYDSGNTLPYDTNRHIKYNVKIGKNVWVGDRVTIVGNLTIEDGAILAAGTVVTRNVPFCAIVGGVPATIIKYRDIEHYNKLSNI